MSWMQLPTSKVLLVRYSGIICQQYFQKIIKLNLELDNPILYQ